MAEVHRASGRPKDALALLQPLADKLAGATLSTEAAPLYEGLLTVLLKAHLAEGQSEAAIADMQKLEKAGSSKEKLTQLYFELSKSLQKDMEAQSARHDPNLPKTQAAYRQFLNALAGSQAGQSYDSLMFAGESLLGLTNTSQSDAQAMAKDAAGVFERVIKTYENDAEFHKVSGWQERLLRTRLRLAEALRKQKQFPQAQALVDELLKNNPRLLEPRLEQGYLLEDWAQAEPRRWPAAYSYWRKLADQLERVRTRRLDYYDAIYHVALALDGMKRRTEAFQTLKSITTLSPTVGSPEMKKKYEALMKRLGS